MSFLERLRSPGARAQRTAGPSAAWLAAAMILGGVAIAALAGTVVRDVDWPWLALVPIVLTTLVALADRDGWLAREAIIYVALEQGRRWRHGKVPLGAAAATAWLADPAHAEATNAERASMFLAAGSYDEALALIDMTAGDETAEDRVRRFRLHSAIEAMRDPTQTTSVDVAGVVDAAASLPVDERRYHVASAAWTQAWLDVVARRPWKARFVTAVRGLEPFGLSFRYWFLGVALQELLLPLILSAAFLFLYLFVRI